MKPLKRILFFAKPHQKYLFLSIFFNILYSILNIFSLATMLPILGLLFGTVDKIDTSVRPVYSDSFSTYVKDLAQYTIQTDIDKYGAVQVLAVLCSITAVAFLLRNVFRYLGAFFFFNYSV
jgi:subfamily B ATP-binding cassette protein MsbA